jgi:hypothetical protein
MSLQAQLLVLPAAPTCGGSPSTRVVTVQRPGQQKHQACKGLKEWDGGNSTVNCSIPNFVQEQLRHTELDGAARPRHPLHDLRLKLAVQALVQNCFQHRRLGQQLTQQLKLRLAPACMLVDASPRYAFPHKHDT